MSLIITLILLGAVNLAICNPSDPYTEDCAPPSGFLIDNSDNSTTPSGLVYEYPIKPIERCCPACDKCVTIGGHCKLAWIPEMYPEWCDFTTQPECRDYSCTCCIKCVEDKCSPCTETGGNCRKVCRSGELEDTQNVCSFHNNGTDGCKCCKRCETTSECTDAYGYCVTDKDDCGHGTYASTGCCGGCYCCKPVFEPVNGGDCDPLQGCYCPVDGGDDCAEGFYPCPNQCSKTITHGGLSEIVPGYACIPKNTGSGIGRIDQLALMVNQDSDTQQQQQQQHQAHRRHPKRLFH